MKNLKKLSRKQLQLIQGGKSCAFTCRDGSIATLSSCSTCLEYQGDGVACYEARENAIHVATC